MSADVFDLASERARRHAAGKPVVAALVVYYVLDDDGVPIADATFSVAPEAIADPEEWLAEWMPGTAAMLLDAASRQAISNKHTPPHEG